MSDIRQLREARLIRLWLVVFLIIAFLAALFASREDPDNWTTADWVNFGISILLGLSFLLLSQHVNHNAQRRAEAVANAGLLTSTGVLAMNSARSVLGAESSALRVAADARSALQHYPLATELAKTDTKETDDTETGTHKSDSKKKVARSMKEVLVKSIIDAYIDLAFSAFLHSGRLARSVWTRLCEGTADVVADLDKLAYTESGEVKDKELASVADHVGFVELLGRALRKDAEKDLTFPGSRRLTTVWDSTKLPYVRKSPVIRSDIEETIYRLRRFEQLYKYELTVMHDWKMLRRNADKLRCEVELVSITATDKWLAPWYIGQGTDGETKPVNVMGGDLDERARYDKPQVDKSTPRWPNPLPQGGLPHGMRSASINTLCQVLATQPSPIITVIAYDICIDKRKGETKRLVLDGNHRLAAARRMSLEHSNFPEGETRPQQFKVLTFLIHELQPINDWSTTGHPEKEPTRWKGFTPDIGLVRGTWLPKRSHN